jgi:hypothetical protein
MPNQISNFYVEPPVEPPVSDATPWFVINDTTLSDWQGCLGLKPTMFEGQLVQTWYSFKLTIEGRLNLWELVKDEAVYQGMNRLDRAEAFEKECNKALHAYVEEQKLINYHQPFNWALAIYRGIKLKYPDTIRAVIRYGHI